MAWNDLQKSKTLGFLKDILSHCFSRVSIYSGIVLSHGLRPSLHPDWLSEGFSSADREKLEKVVDTMP